jgi:hypothetical protein
MRGTIFIMMAMKMHDAPKCDMDHFIRFHDLHANDTRGPIGEITSYQERD